MAEPTKKSPELTDFLDRTFDRTNKIKADKCTTCDGDATWFDDDLSAREYRISGMCQVCQDKTFGGKDAY